MRTSHYKVIEYSQIKFIFNQILKLQFLTGELLLSNWRPIPLSEICFDQDKNVSDIFNQLSSVPTMKAVIR